jgi:dTDP-4-keto-6-deoxyhexose 4-ketoreductase
VKPLVVVLGASGFLGTAVTRQLLARPIRLRLVARRPIEVPAGSLADVEIRSADLAEPGAVADAVEGADAVIHLVAHIDGPSTWRVEEGDPVAERVNLGLVHDLVDAFRGRQGPPPVVVFSGSMSQVGKPTGRNWPPNTPCGTPRPKACCEEPPCGWPRCTARAPGRAHWSVAWCRR